jgi:RHS repeat-associated protein
VSTLGLYHYGARFYSTLVGRFVSPDPVVQDVNDPQALNAYSYVRNDPLVYVDPTGMYVDPIVPQAPFPSLGLGGAASSGPDIPNLVLSYVDCALNGDCAGAGMTQEAAQALIANPSFWEISFHDYNALNDMFWGVVDLLLEGGMTEERMALIPEAGWREMARNWRVTPGFLRASLFDLVYGNAVKTSELGARDIVGAYPWWHYVYDSGDPVAVIRMMLLADKYHFDWVHNGEAIETVLAYMTITLWYFLGPNPPTPLPWSTWQIAEVLAIERGPPNSQKACLSGTGLEVRTVNPSSSSAGPGAACN